MYSFKTIIKLLDKFAEIIYGLIIITLIIVFIKIVYPPFIQLFPFNSHGFLGDIGYYNLLFYTERPMSLGPFRIQSIFWEPGAWAVNQCFAFIWYMIYKKDVKKYFLFALSLIFTFSTTGLIFMLIFSVYLYIYIFDIQIKTIFRKRALIISLILVGLISYGKSERFILIPVSGNDNHTFIDQLTRALLFMTVEKFIPRGVTYGSYENRLQTHLNIFKLSKDRPFIGVGMLKREYAPQITSVYGEIIYQLGYLFLFFWLILFSKFFLVINIVFSIPLMFLLLYAEAYTFGTLFLLLISFGSRLLLIKNCTVLSKTRFILNVT